MPDLLIMVLKADLEKHEHYNVEIIPTFITLHLNLFLEMHTSNNFLSN